MENQNQSQVEFSAEDLENLTEDLFEEKQEQEENILDEFEDKPEPEEKKEEEDKPETLKDEEKDTEEEVDKKIEESQPKNTSDFTELAKEFVGSGEWEDVIIEGEEGEEKKLSELIEEGKVDKETFLSVKKGMDDAKKEELNKNYIKVDGLEESKRKLIEIIKEGKTEEVKNLLTEEPDLLEEPFKGFDNDNDKHNEHVLAWYYKAKGNSDSETEVLVEKAKKDLTADSIAAEVVQKAREQHKIKLDNKAEEVKQKNVEEAKALKEYKKDLSSKFKELGIKETTLKKFTDFATKENEEGQLPVDSMYEDIMSDPQKAVDFIYYMLEPEDFIKKKSENLLRNKSKETLMKIKRIPQDQKSKGASKKTGGDEEVTKAEDWIDQLEFTED